MQHKTVRRISVPLAMLAVALTSTLSADAQRAGSAGDGASAAVEVPDMIRSITPRSIGPAAMSGRVVDIAVASSHGARGGELGTVVYIAAASGGVWKSTNGGTSWEPIFDDAGVGSIGDIGIAPSNSNVVYVGTGEANSQRSSSYGDGVYRSLDGGKTWEHVGLRESQHVGRIVVHPENPDVVYVAAVGPLWAAGGQRGLFKSVDGGANWNAVLTLDEHTGVTDVVMDPSNPDVLYAASYQRERRAFGFIGGGPGSGIWKSADAGETWTRLTRGLPEGDMGRIGLDISLNHPATLYAVTEGSDAGVYRTDDGGLNWRQTDDIQSIPWYFGQIRVDPVDPDVVYHLGVPLMRSQDGGVTWESVGRGGVHVDHHALWINPENRNHLILGNDGGLYVTRDYAETWDWSADLPISQFYAIGYDMQEPFYGVYGGFQDNNTWGGPSRTRYAMGIPNSLWFVMAGGDGFYAAVDPGDHTIAYVESQNGGIVRYDGRTGDRKSIRPNPAPGEMPYRFNWSAPIQISPFDPATVYFAANYVFKSTDRGDSWTRLGEDLTQAIDRDSLEMMGEIPGPNAVSRHQGVAVFSNISSIDVSALRPGLLVTGSDDGVISVSLDDGQSWTKRMRFSGVPDTTYVSKVRWSKHDENVIYATFDGHRSNDFMPYVLRSDDQGESWTSIASDLPPFGSVRAFAQHHENPDLLFVGTEMAPYVSINGGRSWVRIAGMPPVRIDDIKVHPRDNDLIIGTHGRGIYIVDDLMPWQVLAQAEAAGEPFMMPAAEAIAFVPDPSQYSGLHAARDYAGENPPVGTTIRYLLPGGVGDAKLEILDGSGEVVRNLDAPSRAGFHHMAWDLRMDTPWSGPPEEAQRQPVGFGGGFFGGGNRGPLVAPGAYRARLTLSDGDEPDQVMEAEISVLRDENMRLSNAQLAQLQDVRLEYLELNASLQMALASADEIDALLDDATAAVEKGRGGDDLSDQVESIRDEVGEVRSALRASRGFGGGANRPTPNPAPVQSRLQLASGIMRATAMPTAQEMEALRSVPADLAREIERLNVVISARVPALVDALDAAGMPWTPGRMLRPVGE
jgi:photosystem II stability/assembly factor-like uncharacterized protein